MRTGFVVWSKDDERSEQLQTRDRNRVRGEKRGIVGYSVDETCVLIEQEMLRLRLRPSLSMTVGVSDASSCELGIVTSALPPAPNNALEMEVERC